MSVSESGRVRERVWEKECSDRHDYPLRLMSQTDNDVFLSLLKKISFLFQNNNLLQVII